MFGMDGNAPKTPPLVMMRAHSAQALRYALPIAALFHLVPSLLRFCGMAITGCSRLFTPAINKFFIAYKLDLDSHVWPLHTCASVPHRLPSSRSITSTPSLHASPLRHDGHKLERPVNLHSYSIADPMP